MRRDGDLKANFILSSANEITMQDLQNRQVVKILIYNILSGSGIFFKKYIRNGRLKLLSTQTNLNKYIIYTIWALQFFHE